MVKCKTGFIRMLTTEMFITDYAIISIGQMK